MTNQGLTHDSVDNYLSNRFVDINEHIPERVPIMIWVSQGSIPDLLLYWIFLLTTQHFILQIKFSVHHMHMAIRRSMTYVNGSTQVHYLYIPRKHMRDDRSRYSIKIGNTKLDIIWSDCKEQSTNFLGMLIDDNLIWKLHIEAVKRNASIEWFWIKQVEHVLPSDNLRTLSFR